MVDGVDLWPRVEKANRLLLSGRGAEARVAFLDVWSAASNIGDDYPACAAAHMLGVMEPMPLDWKLKWYADAFERALKIRDGRVETWYASLHLILGHTYRIANRIREAIALYESAGRHLGALDDGPYTEAIRASITQALVELKSADQGGAGQ